MGLEEGILTFYDGTEVIKFLRMFVHKMRFIMVFSIVQTKKNSVPFNNDVFFLLFLYIKRKCDCILMRKSTLLKKSHRNILPVHLNHLYVIFKGVISIILYPLFF